MYNYTILKKYLSPDIIENLVCIFKTGSQLFCNNCKDYDYVIITNVDVYLPCFHINKLKSDFFVMSVETLNKKLKDNQWRYKLSVCMAKVDDRNVIYGELPELDIDIISRDYLINVVLPIEKEFAQKTYFIGKGAGKTAVWGLALYYAIINGNFEYTAEQKQVLQQCHDTGLSAWDELKANFEKLI